MKSLSTKKSTVLAISAAPPHRRSVWFRSPPCVQYPPRDYWAKLQNRALPTLVPQANSPHYLMCLDGLLTANKVAREFEFTPLPQRVSGLSHSPGMTAKTSV